MFGKSTAIWLGIAAATAYFIYAGWNRDPRVSKELGSIAKLLQPFIDKRQLAGAVVLVADYERILSIDAVGFADLRRNKRMTSDALFWIASQTKPMTAVAVLILVDEGKIALDDPVEKYLPEFREQMVAVEKSSTHMLLRKAARPITIRQVLSHTSGLPFRSSIEEPTLDTLPLATAVRSYATTPLLTEPGTAYHYSSAGTNTAARVLEVVSKMPYEQFLQQRLLAPLGMKDTTFWPNQEQLSRLAKSYRADASRTRLIEAPIDQLRYPLGDRERRFPIPGGGLFSTAQDTAIFCQMLLNRGSFRGRRYLSEASFRELTRRQTPPSMTESYGLGLAVDGNSFGHSGRYITHMEVHPDNGIALVWMVQNAGFAGEVLRAQDVFLKAALERFGRQRKSGAT